MIPDRRRVLSNLFDRLYGGSIIRNDLRGELVEEIVGQALAPEWQPCGSDWGACDLRHEGLGLKIQVKQSAARQTWTPGSRGPGPTRFSIALPESERFSLPTTTSLRPATSLIIDRK